MIFTLIQEVTGLKYIKDSKGFTLVEVMVALTILVIGIIFAVAIGTQATRLNRITQKGLNAQSAASQVYELLSAVPFSSQSLLDDGDVNDLDDITEPDHVDSVKIGATWYPVVWNVADNRLGNEFRVGYKTIRIIVLDPFKPTDKLYSITLVRGAGA